MTTIRFRATGPQTGFDALMAALEGVDGVEHLEELADLMPHMDDDDSSSAGLPDDIGASDVHDVEVEVASPYAETVTATADDIAARYGLVIEYVDDF
jgi:hypothetical protein